MDDPHDGSYIVTRTFESAIDILNGMSDKIETIWDIGGRRPYEEGLKSSQLRQVLKLYVMINGNANAYPNRQLTFPAKKSNGWTMCRKAWKPKCESKQFVKETHEAFNAAHSFPVIFSSTEELLDEYKFSAYVCKMSKCLRFSISFNR